MQRLATAGQMRECDRAAIERYGIPGLVLMENAGRGCVDVLEQSRGLGPETRVLIAAGKGNNGGDGFVIARHLLRRGCSVDVALAASPDEIKGDARTNLKILEAMAGERLRFIRLEGIEDAVSRLPGKPEIIVDALVGTGASGALSGVAAVLAGWINRTGSFVLAVDVPSGVDATTGAVQGTAVRADRTVTMGLAKPGLYLGAGRDAAGDVVVVDIGIPAGFFPAGDPQILRMERSDAAASLPARPWNAHKYSVGKVFVLGGSRAFTGAPCLTAESGLVAGAGAVVLGVPASVHGIVAGKLSEVIVQPLPETSAGTVRAEARDAVAERCAWADVVVLGPGLGRDAGTDALVLDLLQTIERPVVLDADGLNSLAGQADLLLRRKGETVLTPHAGELGRLTGEPAGAIEARRVDAEREAAQRFRCTVVLKGAPTATAWRDGTVVLNSSGNAGMATIGAGDVLTGLLAGLWAQGMRPEEAAATAVYIHGCAGDDASETLGIRSVRASDIMRALPGAFLKLEGA